jgi:type II secretion system protein N
LERSRNDMMMNPIRNRILYFIYILAAAAFFIYYLFPSNAAKKYITNQLNKTRSDFSVSIDDIKTSFPPGLRLHDVGVNHLSVPFMRIKEIKIFPEILSLFRSKTAFCLQGSAYEGLFDGKAYVSGKQSDRRITVDMRLSDIQIRDIPMLRNLFSHEIGGILDGQVNYHSNGGFNGAGTARAEFCISGCTIDLPTPVFNLKNFIFKTIDTHVVLENQNLQIRECVIKGMQMDGKISGSILLKYPGGGSVLDLDGILNPHPSFLSNLENNIPVNFFLKKRPGKKGLEFRIQGTFDRPELSLK